MKKICLDAGHYGKYNRSPSVAEYWESERMWDLHLLLKTELEAYGFQVVTTRSDQTKDLSLSKRGMTAKGCDLFLSLHSNAVGTSVNESIDYVSVYHFVEDNTTLDETSKAIAEKLAPVVADTMDVKGGYKVLSRKSSNDRNGDGLLNDNYYGVLHSARQAGAPGLLIEHSFHTNTRSTNWLLDNTNLAKLAKSEAKVIADYFGVTQNQNNVELTLPTLRSGSTGETVKSLQRILHSMGYSLGSKNPIDGNFGSKTCAAVKEYQKSKDLHVDGIVGRKTWTSLLGL